MLNNCGLYRPGHQMHWIQAKKSSEPEQPIILVKIVAVSRDGLIDLESADAEFRLWHHDLRRLVQTFDVGDTAEWRPKYHVLRTVWAGLFNMAAPDRAMLCRLPNQSQSGSEAK